MDGYNATGGIGKVTIGLGVAVVILTGLLILFMYLWFGCIGADKCKSSKATISSKATTTGGYGPNGENCDYFNYSKNSKNLKNSKKK